jgi:hypothetical protein
LESSHKNDNPPEQEKEVKLYLDAGESNRESLTASCDVKLEDNSSIALESNLYNIIYRENRCPYT